MSKFSRVMLTSAIKDRAEYNLKATAREQDLARLSTVVDKEAQCIATDRVVTSVVLSPTLENAFRCAAHTKTADFVAVVVDVC